MIAHLLAGHYPRNARQRAIQGLGREVGDRADVAELTVLLYGVEPGEGIPNLRRLGALRLRRAGDVAVCAVRLGSLGNVIAPADM